MAYALSYAPSHQKVATRGYVTSSLDRHVIVAHPVRRLHLHCNTLRSRIEELERIVGPFRDDARVRFHVHVALLILRMAKRRARAD